MDNKSKTKIDQYLQWPMKLMLFLVPADILIFFFSVECGIILAVFIVLGILLQAAGYRYSRNEIMKECIGFVFEQGRFRII